MVIYSSSMMLRMQSNYGLLSRQDLEVMMLPRRCTEICLSNSLKHSLLVKEKVLMLPMTDSKIVVRLQGQNHNASIYSGSATRTPSLPYSTPRVTYSRFRNHYTNSLWRRSLHKVAYSFSGTRLTTEFFHTKVNHTYTTSPTLYKVLG